MENGRFTAGMAIAVGKYKCKNKSKSKGKRGSFGSLWSLRMTASS